MALERLRLSPHERRPLRMDWRWQSSSVKFTSGSLLTLSSSSSTCSKKSLPQISWILPYAALFLSSWPSIRSFNILLTFSHSSSVYDGHHASAFGSWTSVPMHSPENSPSSFQTLSLPPGSTVFTRMSVRGRLPESTSESTKQFPSLPTLIRGCSLSPSFPPLFFDGAPVLDLGSRFHHQKELSARRG